jgi:hypothetical protein
MFDISTSTDFYAMLVQDFDEYMDETHSARKALHCAITAYHLREWIWKDWLVHDLSAQNAMGIRDQNSFNNWVVGSCVWFPFLRDLVNGTKHFTDRHSFEAMRVMAVPFAFGQVKAGFGERGVGWPDPVCTRFIAFRT